jgi:flagellar hook-basal body complex protein FliE
MSVDAIAALGAVGHTLPVAPTFATAPANQLTAPAFMERVVENLGDVNVRLQRADQLLRQAAAGENIAPHTLMIAMEEAQMSLMLTVEVRNRVVEAYQELMRMQL